MEKELLHNLINGLSAQLVWSLFQVVAISFIFLAIKDFASKLLVYLKLKFSDLGRGTKIEIDNYVGYISNLGFTEIEIEVDSHTTMIVPIKRFLNVSKIIMRNGKPNGKK